jgi:signal transduction histidine kinase
VELTYKQTPGHSKASVYGDKNRTKQVIYNLVGNALKFTDKGSITMEIKQDGPLLKVLISDTGPGISAGAQQLLFHKFQQAGDSLITRDTAHGTGLGLYISKLIVENMGGSIQLESSVPGTGSVFSFSLPSAKHHAQL